MADVPILLVSSLRAAQASRILLPAYDVHVWVGGGEDISPYRDADVLVWPDSSAEGPPWSDEIRNAVAPISKRLRVLDVTDHSGGWDACSALDEGWLPESTLTWCRARLNGTHGPTPEPIIEQTAPEPVVNEPEQSPPSEQPPGAIPQPGPPPKTRKKRNLSLSTGGAEEQPDLDLPSSFMRWNELGLELNGRGIPHWNVDNCERALNKHPLTAGRFWWDEFHCKVFTTWGIAQGDESIIPRELNDVDPVAIAVFMQRKMGMFGINDMTIKKTINRIAADAIRCEPKEWMDSLEWDGTERLLSFLPKYLGTPDTEYHQKAGRNFFRGMVARIYHPGCKMDNVLVLQGKQGLKKSTALAVVGGPWYAEGHEEVGSKDFYLTLHGKLVVEIAEMDSFTRAEIAKVKQVITCSTDRYRTPYGQLSVDYPRRSVFVGSTNEEVFLRDPSGARRFWPVTCGVINIPALQHDRVQLFAEAVAEFKRGAGWWDMPEQETLEMQNERQESDDWAPLVRRYLEKEQRNGVWEDRYEPLMVATVADVLAGAVNKPAGQWTKQDTKRVTDILRHFHWKREPVPEPGTGHHYVRPRHY